MDSATTFATLYLLAQGIERFVELFSNLPLWGNAISTDPAVKRRRVISLWIFSSVIGAGACFLFHVDFFAVYNKDIPVATKILSGVIVGSGTKPIHDLLTGIEKYARKS
jgi:hypothetical protein